LISMLLVLTTLLPSAVRASPLSDFFAKLGAAKTVQTEIVSGGGNVQTMSLLTPAMNINPTPATGGGGITVVDQSALVPQEGPSGTIADIVKPKNGTISVYVVHAGDTLSGISQLFNIPESTLLWANNLTRSSVISPGDKLTILPVAGIQYTVKTGDTLALIAKRTGGDATDIGSYNGVDDSSLVVGSQLLIPDGEASASVPTTVSGTQKSNHLASSGRAHGSATRILQGLSASGSVVPMANNPAEPAHNVGPVGSLSEISYYIAPLTHYIQTQGIHGYNAVDLAAPVGTPVLASADGEVIVARAGGWNGGYGSYVVITHDNGSQTLYAHMSSVVTYDGAEVVQGQVIGYVGMSGSTTGPHVHFEIRNGIRNPF
jgi:murein DD-endopeptidase MepM/ murein hydrolase activator NlpD